MAGWGDKKSIKTFHKIERAKCVESLETLEIDLQRTIHQCGLCEITRKFNMFNIFNILKNLSMFLPACFLCGTVELFTESTTIFEGGGVNLVVPGKHSPERHHGN